MRLVGPKKVTAILLFFVLWMQKDLEARPRPRPPTYKSCIYQLHCPPLPQGEVTYINGMNHKPDRAIRCASMLSDLTGGYGIFTIYNPTRGFLHDLAHCWIELYHFRMTQPVRKLHEKWNHFFATHDIHEKILQFCHSQGSIQVRNALLRYPPHLRNRIIVVAIAPAAYIPDFLCCEAFHYASRRDIVPKLDTRGKRKCAHKTVVLTPHPEAAFFDHHFLSPTFRAAINHHLRHYLEHECHFTFPTETEG